MEDGKKRPQPRRNALILCFDGTGNKFSGNTSDSNIIKIFSMIDRQSPNIHSYYQPGIGTYIEDSALSKTSRLAKIRSWYVKAKDQAVGTSFDRHVMAGYEFLVENYTEGDDIYFFGFSRGAYIARFLAQMLDSVGLLSKGNDEMMRFAWKAFAEWQTRLDETAEQKKKKKQTYEFMRAFRETFSRPVRRIRFLGLFDTVNSVPRFETAWLKRARYPYTAKSSAKIIRHAVAIDERRAKFRQNLVSQKRNDLPTRHKPARRAHKHTSNGVNEKENRPAPIARAGTTDFVRFTPRRNAVAPSVAPSINGQSRFNSRQGSTASINSTTPVQPRLFDDVFGEVDSDDEATTQDLQELWFPGCHADIGGGWPQEPGMEAGLSYAPLLWMIREARKAGLPFDEEALQAAGYVLDDDLTEDINFQQDATDQVPQIRVGHHRENNEKREAGFNLLHLASTRGMIHDSLQFGCGTPGAGVLSWRIMEYLPFRRMDLKPDGTWAPIRWPLPCGEVRDIPDEAWIHATAIKRMEADKNYRPGNLIVGGGGRGVRKAPEHMGTGKWNVHREKGNPVGEAFIRAPRESADSKEGAWNNRGTSTILQ